MASKKTDLKSEADPKKDTITQKKLCEEVAKVLEDDDDDFEEFNQEDWQDIQVDEKIDVKQWREDWDDEDIHDEFNQELRKQIGA